MCVCVCVCAAGHKAPGEQAPVADTLICLCGVLGHLRGQQD